ncbi:TYR [Ectocarpus sp. CCAP 1310/34]|nr:TYR [Ectocarpus sp. CCAP 1310/34]
MTMRIVVGLLLIRGATPKPFPSSVVALPTFGLGNEHREHRDAPQQRQEEEQPGRASIGGTASAPSTGAALSGGEEDDTSPHAQIRDEETSVLSLTSTNGYPDISWSPWAHLAEPHRASVLRAESQVGNPDDDVFLWTLPNENGASFQGREIEYTFTEPGRKDIVLTQTVTSTGERHTLHTHIMVKYVRREIRTLHNSDRVAFFDALETLYRLPTSEGVQQFGSDYKGIDYFVQLHLDGAGVKDCDHWHDDAGIMTHHVGFTLQFEQAMQLVDPSVTIPYWEYSIEATDDLDSYGDSIVFDHDWFGEFSPNNDFHTMTKGRWAFLRVQRDAWDSVHNPYGLLRSPWNVDDTPFVTRHNTTSSMTATDMVSCSVYSSCFASSSLSIMNACLNGETHGPVHILTGGEWHAAEEDFIQKVGYYESVPLVTKFLWRKGYLSIPDKCEVGESCQTSCPSELYESKGMTPYDVLMDVHALMWTSHTASSLVYSSRKDKFEVKGYEDDEPFQRAYFKKMLNSFCNPGAVGEMFTSAAPYDPVFWVVHPTADRLLAWRRMLGRQGVEGWDFDETWGYTHTSVVGETGTVCNWDDVVPGSGDMPTCITGICGGHNEDDLLPFTVKVKGENVQLTNAEWMDLIYPTNEDLPYMYDEFKWDHCSEDGYSFGT